MKKTITKALGLYTHPNQLTLPEGAATTADNVVVNRDDVWEPIRGVSAYATQTAARIFSYNGTVMLHSANSSGSVKYDNGSGTFTAVSGTFSAPDASAAKMRAAVAAQDFFFTTSGGVYRMDSSSATPALSGAVKATGFDRDGRVYTANAGSMSLTTNVVSVTTTAAHGFYVGQVITQTSATEAPYAAGNYTVASVPSSTSFTYALVAGDDAANANPHTFAPAALVTAGGFLTDGNQVAYRVVFNCPDSNNVEKPGAPSPRTVIANASGTPGWVTTEAKNVVVRAFVPSGVAVTHRIRLYRSKQVATSIEPDDELQLVYEALVKSVDITRGWVDIADVTPDALRGDTLYTAPSQEGESGSNERPPLAKDIALFNGSMHYANTTGLQRITVNILAVGSPSGVQSDDRLVIGNGQYTAQTTPTSSAHYKLETSGTAAVNIRNTALNLCAAVNRDASGTFYAFYDSSGTDAPGRIVFEARTPSVSSSTVLLDNYVTAAAGKRTAWAPALDSDQVTVNLSRTSNVVTATVTVGLHNFYVGEQVTNLSPSQGSWGAGPFVVTAVNAARTTFTYSETGANDSTTNLPFEPTNRTRTAAETRPNRVYASKVNQPEAVTALSYNDLGERDADILRIIATRSCIFAFKEDGLYRGTGSNGVFDWSLFDPTVILLAPDSAQVLGNMVYAYTTQGVVAVSDTGVEIVSRSIERTLKALNAASLTKMKQLTYGIAYESERQYILRTISSSSDTSCTQGFIYNTLNQTWTRETRTAAHGIINPSDDKLYLVGSTQILKERKDNAYSDYSEADLSVTIASLTSTTATLSSASGVTVGDILYQGGFGYLITAISTNTLTLYPADTSDLSAGAATIKVAISSAIQWAPYGAQDPSSEKTFTGVGVLFGNAYIHSATATYSNDLFGPANTPSDSLDMLTLAAQWGTASDDHWGGTEVPYNLTLDVPQELRRACRLGFKLSIRNAWAAWDVSGIKYLSEGDSDKVSR